MKKITAFIIVLAAGLAVASTAQAQNKTGYISVDQMVLLMPETAKVDTLMAIYEKDSLNPQLNYIVGEYQRKDSMYRDSVKTPAAVRKQLEGELQQYLYQINNWDNIKQQVMQSKQQSLLNPIYEKVVKAINDIAKEKGYNYIYSQEALLVAPPGDNILPLVAEKLKVKLPAATGNPPAANKTPGKTNN